LFPIFSGFGESEICTLVTLTVAVPDVNAGLDAEPVIVVLPAPTGVTVTVVLNEPAGTVTLAGTVAAPVLLLAKLITCPLGPAGDVRPTVNVPDALAARLNGFGVSDINTLVTLTVAVPGVKPTLGAEAVIVVLPALTAETVTVVLDAPSGIVTLAGTVAAPVLLLARLITCPPDPAGDVRLTVSVPDAFAARLNGLGASVISTFETFTPAAPDA